MQNVEFRPKSACTKSVRCVGATPSGAVLDMAAFVRMVEVAPVRLDGCSRATLPLLPSVTIALRNSVCQSVDRNERLWIGSTLTSNDLVQLKSTPVVSL